MKRGLFWLCLMCGMRLWAEMAPADFLLIAPEGMEAAVVDRVRDWMASNLHFPVRVRRCPDWGGKTALEQVEALGAIPEPGLVTVVLSNTLDEGKHAVVLPGKNLGFIHVGLLAPEVNEKTLRRLDRQAIRIVGFSLGIPPQPIPFCALCPYEDLKQLDQMGRGFSPPAMAWYRAALEARGVELTPEASEFLPQLKVPSAPPAPQE